LLVPGPASLPIYTTSIQQLLPYVHHPPTAASLSLLSPLRYRRRRSTPIPATARSINSGSSLIWSLDYLLSLPLVRIQRHRSPTLLLRGRWWQGVGGAREEAATDFFLNSYLSSPWITRDRSAQHVGYSYPVQYVSIFLSMDWIRIHGVSMPYPYPRSIRYAICTLPAVSVHRSLNQSTLAIKKQ
jgi:hypothetical protein